MVFKDNGILISNYKLWMLPNLKTAKLYNGKPGLPSTKLKIIAHFLNPTV